MIVDGMPVYDSLVGRWFSALEQRFDPVVDAAVRANFRALPQGYARTMESVLREHYYRPQDGFLDSVNGRQDLAEHVDGRLRESRELIMPWLTSFTALSGRRVIEIGSGSGSSTAALAEQGALITGIDLSEGASRCARTRLDLLGLSAELRLANAATDLAALAAAPADLIIFYASLEHMTHAERLGGLSSAWQALAAGGWLVVVEAPNRLWHTDLHSSHLPFFDWLPHELALAYASHSPRPEYASALGPDAGERMQTLLRLGRGVSFHEFDLALGAVDVLRSSSLAEHRSQRNALRRMRQRWSRDGRYSRLLQRRCGRPLPSGFFAPYLNLALQKP